MALGCGLRILVHLACSRHVLTTPEVGLKPEFTVVDKEEQEAIVEEVLWEMLGP